MHLCQDDLQDPRSVFFVITDVSDAAERLAHIRATGIKASLFAIPANMDNLVRLRAHSSFYLSSHMRLCRNVSSSSRQVYSSHVTAGCYGVRGICSERLVGRLMLTRLQPPWTIVGGIGLKATQGAPAGLKIPGSSKLLVGQVWTFLSRAIGHPS